MLKGCIFLTNFLLGVHLCAVINVLFYVFNGNGHVITEGAEVKANAMSPMVIIFMGILILFSFSFLSVASQEIFLPRSCFVREVTLTSMLTSEKLTSLPS